MKKPGRRIEIVLWVAAFAVIALVGRYVLPTAETGQAESRTVRIGYVSWAEGIAMTHLAKVVLEDRMHYDVELTLADPAPIFTSLAEGSLDVFLDAWLPRTHQSHMEEYKDTLSDLGYNYEGARIGLVVPAYVDVDSIPAMADRAALFDGAITGIDSGAGIMEATRKAIRRYDLDMELMTSSGAAMTASLSDAVQREAPIVVTGWKPHWMFARWELKFLDDPRTVYGEEENLHTLARPGFSRDFPEVAAFLKAFQFDDQQIGSLMDTMNRHESEAEAARKWMADHARLVDSWLSPPYKGN